jgi:hypothetical protein
VQKRKAVTAKRAAVKERKGKDKKGDLSHEI